MSRKEQIRKASIEYTMSVRPNAIGGSKFEDLIEAYNTNPSFIAGAEWADKTLNEKVCEWLKTNLKKYVSEDTKAISNEGSITIGFNIDVDRLTKDIKQEILDLKE